MNLHHTIHVLGRYNLSRITGESLKTINNWLIIPQEHREKVRGEVSMKMILDRLNG